MNEAVNMILYNYSEFKDERPKINQYQIGLMLVLIKFIIGPFSKKQHDEQ